MKAYFDGFTITMTREQAESVSHPGPCDDDAAALAVELADQLDLAGPEAIWNALHETGGWLDEELTDDAENRVRLVWVAAGNIIEG